MQPTWSQAAGTIVRRTARGSDQTPCDCLGTPGPRQRAHLHARTGIYVIVTSSPRRRRAHGPLDISSAGCCPPQPRRYNYVTAARVALQRRQWPTQHFILEV